MADVENAIEQDQIAESLLGDQPQETVTDNATAGTEAETAEQVETQAEVEQPLEENADDWLPNDQDKVFPDEVYAKYAQRYQLTPEQAADPLLRQLLHDKINGDIYFRQLQEQQDFQELQPEPEPTQPIVEQKIPTLDEHMATLNQWSEKFTDPKVAQMFGDQFLKAFGVNEPAKPETARALAHTMSTFGLNLIQTALPQVLPAMLDSVMPGFSGMYYTASRAASWDNVRNSSPQYRDLPDYGSKEFDELTDQLMENYPALTEMGITLAGGGNGARLSGAAADKFYTTLAKLAIRPQADPVLLQQAAQAGARSARRGEVRRSAGNLGAGQSKGAVTNRPDNGDNADIFDEGLEIYRREHGKM